MFYTDHYWKSSQTLTHSRSTVLLTKIAYSKRWCFVSTAKLLFLDSFVPPYFFVRIKKHHKIRSNRTCVVLVHTSALRCVFRIVLSANEIATRNWWRCAAFSFSIYLRTADKVYLKFLGAFMSMQMTPNVYVKTRMVAK